MGRLSNINGQSKESFGRNILWVEQPRSMFDGLRLRKDRLAREVHQQLIGYVRHLSRVKPSISVRYKDHNRHAPKDPLSSFAKGA